MGIAYTDGQSGMRWKPNDNTVANNIFYVMYDATWMAYSMTPTPTLSCGAFDLFAQGGFMALIRHIADADYYNNIWVLSIFS